MNTIEELKTEVQKAWSYVGAPAADDMAMFDYEWGEKASKAFTGVPPMKVDTGSEGFLVATPLLVLPPEAGAAYLGTYLFSFLEGLDFQKSVGIFHDLITRSHLLNCLSLPEFWQDVVSLLPEDRLRVLLRVCRLIIAEREELNLDVDQAIFMASKIREYAP